MPDIVIIILRTLLGYIILTVLMKFMGKREIGQLSLFDLLILLTIVDIMVLGIENFKTSFINWVLPMVTMAIIQKIVSLLALKMNWFRTVMDGKGTIIIENGKINVKEMKKNGYNMDDLYVQLRNKDVVSPSEVSYAILETNGKLSVFLKNEYPSFVLPLVVSGKIIKENVIKAGYTENYISSVIANSNYKTIKNVYGLNLVNGKLIFVEANTFQND